MCHLILFQFKIRGHFFTFNQISNTSIKNNCQINGNGGAMKIIETIWWTMEIIDIFRGRAEITMFIIIGSLLILLTKIKKNIFCKDMKK